MDWLTAVAAWLAPDVFADFLTRAAEAAVLYWIIKKIPIEVIHNRWNTPKLHLANRL